tara:strand:+ start:198 stop:713 length:516 start_codon:yes stop_codon:yes gene_type:complete
MSKDSFYIRIFNKHDQIHVQDMVISGLLSTAVNRNKSVKDGISAYLKRSLSEDLGNIYDHYFKDGIFFVAIFDGNIIGCLGAEKHNNFTFRLKRLSVKKEYRKQGIAKELLKSIEKWTKERGANKLILGTSEVQKDALIFWKNSGFQVVESEFVESGIEVFSLEKDLNLNF